MNAARESGKKKKVWRIAEVNLTPLMEVEANRHGEGRREEKERG